MSRVGGNRLDRFPPGARDTARELRQARADARAADLAPVIAEIHAAGVTKLQGIAAALNERGVPTPSGHRHWRPMQVSRLLKRLAG
jgi:Recombinase